MSKLTTDPNDHELTMGVDAEPTEQAKVYLVLSDEERAKGYIRPVRETYVHLRMANGSDLPRVLIDMKDTVGCGAATRMSSTIAETYARDPSFYSHTYCVRCSRHLPVSHFSWEDGTRVGS